MPYAQRMKGEDGPLRVLMVEDEPLLGRFGVQLLEGMGRMETMLARDGVEGLELARSWRPDLILLDLILPGISGLELLRQYRQEGGRAKVLVLTGANLEKIQGQVFALGADHVLAKPVRWREVLKEIELLAGGPLEQCKILLRKLGAEERAKGFRQAAECAALLGERECALLKEVYIEVARKHRTEPHSVSKNIERLAREVHKKNTLLYRKLTGRGPGDPHLTNREFLELLSQAARIPL